MASNYTTNYQLPLWQPEDDFVRTEFNDAHEKIDGAIAGVPVFKIGATEIGLESGLAQFDLSGTDMSGLSCLLLMGSGSGGSTRLTINGDTEGHYRLHRYWGAHDYDNLSAQVNFMLFNFDISETGGCGRAILYPTGGASGVGAEIVSIGPYTERMYGIYSGTAFQQISSIQIKGTAGTSGRFILYGVKK